MTVQGKLRELGLELPAALQRPEGGTYPFVWVRLRGERAYVSGHLPQNPDGTLAPPFGKVILERFGPARGAHARCAVGVAELPFGVPVEIEAEVEVAAR